MIRKSPTEPDEFKEPIPALVKRMVTLGHVLVTTYLTATPSLEAPGAGAVAHMSLHLKPTMSKSRQPRTPTPSAEATKSAGQPSIPDFLSRGTVVRLCWRPALAPPSEWLSGEAHL